MRRHRWFSRGVQARRLADTGPGQDPLSVYRCPLCLGLFDEAAMRDRTLTIEHAPPKALGGRAVALTCKDCNSTAGHGLDLHMQREEAQLNLVAGRPSNEIDVDIVRDGIPVRGSVRVTEDGAYQFVDVPKANHPDNLRLAHEAMDRWASTGETGQTFEIRAREPYSPRVARIGWLRTAYLGAFAFYGYRYLKLPAVEAARQQIARPSEDLMGWLPVLFDPAQGRAAPSLREITTPASMRSVVVLLGRFTVFLPAPGDADPDFFGRLRRELEAIEAGGDDRPGYVASASFTGHDFGWPRYPTYVLDG